MVGSRDAAVQRAFGSVRGVDLPDRVPVRYSGNCTAPARLPTTLGRDVELVVRCRGCPGCLRARQQLWRLRAEIETVKADRTWLFTGTFRDQWHDREPVAEEITRYFKRLRHRAGRLRYLACYERHRSGAFHCHMLLHTDLGTSWRDVTEPWDAGFFKANLLRDHRAASYVTKYVSKDLMETVSYGRRPRIRASRNPRYGDEVMCHEEAIVAQLQKRRIDEVDTHRINLIQLVNAVRPRESDPLWDVAMRLQLSKK